jgi:hypothetical protein
MGHGPFSHEKRGLKAQRLIAVAKQKKNKERIMLKKERKIAKDSQKPVQT